MKTLRLTFYNGATRTVEAASYAKARSGVVIMTPGGSIVRFSREKLCHLQEMGAPAQSKPREIFFKRTHADLGKLGAPEAA